MTARRRNIIFLIVGFMVMAGMFAGSQQAYAFPRGSVFRNLTVNPGAIPSGGTATVTVSYMCEASGCYDKGGVGQLIVKPTGIFKQVSTCSSGYAGTGTIPFSYACFDGPLANDAIVQLGNKRMPSSSIIIPPPEPASPQLHILQAVVEANAATPGSTLIICYQEEPVTGFTDPASLSGTFNASTDLLSLANVTTPPGDPPSSTVSGSTGVYASLCVFVLVTSGSPQSIRFLDVTSTNVNVGARVVVRALVTDQNGNPIPGVNVSFSISDSSQASLTCATTQDFTASGYAFNPIVAGGFPGPAGVPAAGNVANPGVGVQAGQTSLGSPFPLATASLTTTQATPLGYTCYAGTALGGATGLGSVPPGTITSLTDNVGVAYVTMVVNGAGDRGTSLIVTATVFDGGVPPKGVTARTTPFMVIGAALAGAVGTLSVSPSQIVSPGNSAALKACFAAPNGLPVPQGAAVVFTIVQKTPGVVDAAFAQAQAGDQNQQVTRPTASDGCASANAIATGAGTITFSAAIGTSVTTGTVAVGAGNTSAGLTGLFSATPTGSAAICPDRLQWMGLYWRGANSPILMAVEACPSIDRVWARRGATWVGASPAQPQSSDQFDATNGEFLFVHGRS